VTTAELAIVVTGTVGLGSPAIAHAFELIRERRRREGALAEKKADEMRSLLDSLTGTMFEHTGQLITLELWMSDSAMSRFSNNRPAPAVRSTRRELYTLNGRLVIRRGRQDELVTALRDYLRPTDEALAEIDASWEKAEFFYTEKELNERASLYWQKYEDFVDTAKAQLELAEEV
jgi:hypothetical protein